MVIVHAEEYVVRWEHLALLSHAHWGWNSDEAGGPTINPKRPYGNSDWLQDVCDILGWHVADPEEGPSREQYRAASELHLQLQWVLPVLISAGEMRPGTYRRDKDEEGRWGRWYRKTTHD